MDRADAFQIVGLKKAEKPVYTAKKTESRLPYASFVILGIIAAGCMLYDVFSGRNPSYMNLMSYSKAPCREFWFGTDNLGRDIFACIWSGGKVSIFIGVLSTLISTVIAIVYGSVSGLASDLVDTVMMRITEIILSVPSLLVVIFLQAILGQANVFSIAFIIGITSWCSIAKIVRTEVRQLRKSEYVVASRCMGGGFIHILMRHLAPNFISSIMFMVVMNIRSAIVTESTLSFMGMGLPLDVISWGSLLSLANNALMTRAWWIILIPGAFLITLLVCLTNIGSWLRKSVNQKDSNI